MERVGLANRACPRHRSRYRRRHAAVGRHARGTGSRLDAATIRLFIRGRGACSPTRGRRLSSIVAGVDGCQPRSTPAGKTEMACRSIDPLSRIPATGSAQRLEEVFHLELGCRHTPVPTSHRSSQGLTPGPGARGLPGRQSSKCDPSGSTSQRGIARPSTGNAARAERWAATRHIRFGPRETN